MKSAIHRVTYDQSPMGGLPNEIINMIYGFLPDFDEAANLSQTCKALRELYHVGKILITRRIMANSDTYKYDRILYKYEAARISLRQRYEDSEGQLSDDQSRETRLAFYHLRSPIRKLISNEEAHISLQRWQRFKILRRLYVELLPDFDAAHNHEGDGVIPLWDGAIPLQSDSFRARTPVAATELDETFKARFHKALSLHTIAMTFRQLGLAARFKKRRGVSPGQIAQLTATTAWCKGSHTFGKYTIDVTKMEQIDGLEIFDFLYSYLVPELFPRGTFIAWISPMFTTAQTQDCADELIQAYREAYLYPSDIADLLNNKVWEKDSIFPEDKAVYLKNLGFLENLTVRRGWDWWTPFTRRTMTMGALSPEMFIELLRGGKGWGWYDQIRSRAGSPFKADSTWPVHENSESDVEEALANLPRALRAGI
ncbi:MAG: hypothetical protein Q9188_007104 [Gyalolechia gomerana]